MKKLNKNLSLYIILLVIYNIIFRYTLSLVLKKELFALPWVVAGIYAIAIFVTAWNLGKAFQIKKLFYDAGIRFHLATYIVWGVISEAWFLLGYHAKYETIKVVHITLLIWGAGLLLHAAIFLILRKSMTVKGIQKSELFD